MNPSNLSQQLDKEMAVVKEQVNDIRCDVKDVKDDIKKISNKLDKFADVKADKDDVNRMWYWILGIVASILTSGMIFILNFIVKYIDK